ncbi:MAG: DUF58 domain-containing protein [Treponema sp.]|nr:DUF58 domain-containing protein [Treponema sp.]
MDTRDLLKKITNLHIVAGGLAQEMLAGNFRSLFKGQGIEFDEERHYQWGDDAKNIDWNASARLGTAFVKMFREERELAIMLLLDCSASMHSSAVNPWGNEFSETQEDKPSPYEQALLCAALIAFSAERSGQRVGAFLFDHEIQRVFPPRKGKGNVMAIVSGALAHHKAPAKHKNSSNLLAAITGAEQLLKRRSMVIIISDFLSIGWEQKFADLCRLHDVIAVRISGPKDNYISDIGLLSIEDPETGIKISVPTGNVSFRDAWTRWNEDRSDLWRKNCRRAGAAQLELPVDADAAAALTRFFGSRSRH